MTSIPHKSHQRKPDLTAAQWAQYDQLRADGLSLTNAAAAMGLSQATLSRRVEARLHPSNGHLPAIPASQPIAIHRSESIPWVSRGLQVAADMVDAMDAYAARYRLEKREVLDMALRQFFAGQEVPSDA